LKQLESAALVTELAMDLKSQFYALEVMCRERAAMARKEMEYWLNEAEEWTQLRKANHVAALIYRGSLIALLRV
jgi:hypothetical protein